MDYKKIAQLFRQLADEFDKSTGGGEQKSFPTTSDADIPAWSGTADEAWAVEIHFGKNKGTRLADLQAKSLKWYIEDWSAGTKDEDKRVKSALLFLKGDNERTPKPDAGLASKDEEDEVPF